MNKIYNNLTIDNLIKTDLFNQFYPNEQKQIFLGLEDNLDVSLYAKRKYSYEQMEQIRLGLVDNLDVSIYAKPEFNWFQMNEIRLKLLQESTLK